MTMKTNQAVTLKVIRKLIKEIVLEFFSKNVLFEVHLHGLLKLSHNVHKLQFEGILQQGQWKYGRLFK